MSAPNHSHARQVPASVVEQLRSAPLRLRRICLEKVWGGRALEEVLGIQLDRPGQIGETWELVDRSDQQSVVADGPLAGCELGALVQGAGPALLGDARTAANGRFPLLVKFLDATAPLSVQVHPDDDGARRQGGGSEPKTEAWYFLRDGGEVWCGFRPGVERGEFEAALEAGRGESCLARHVVLGGHALTVRGGTVHAIGAGVTLLEVQQNSDTTYRLDDWGRVGLDGQPRDLHRAQALEVTRFDVPAPMLEPSGAAPSISDRHGGTGGRSVARSEGGSEGGAGGQPASPSNSEAANHPSNQSTLQPANRATHEPNHLSGGATAGGSNTARSARRTLLSATEHFELEAIDLAEEPLALDTHGRFQIYVGVGGSAMLFAPNSGSQTPLRIGDLLLVPAVLGPHTLAIDPANKGASSSDRTRVVRLSTPHG